MTKRRRKKVHKIMSYPSSYVEKGKFAYLMRQAKLYNRHAGYLRKYALRSFNKLKAHYLCKED